MNRHDEFMEYMDANRRRNEPIKGPIENTPFGVIMAGMAEEYDEARHEAWIQRSRKSDGRPVDKEKVKREAADGARWYYRLWDWADKEL